MVCEYLKKHQFEPAISSIPAISPRMIVVIPANNEPELLNSLQALYRCNRPLCRVEVIVVINHCEQATKKVKQQNEKSLNESKEWIKSHNDNSLQFNLIYKSDVPVKYSGVGFARKTGMDEAVYRFQQAKVNDGVIIGFDADSTCDENYFVEIERHFFSGKKINGASIYFEHPMQEDKFEAKICEGIALYELHLRYLIQALRYAGFPYAYHTVGSSFAVSANAYVKQGGMNKRKAGEDFHFLHKIIPLGNYIEINTTRVIPSPRQSNRVPFGTGASIRKWMDGDNESLHTYPLELFDDLKELFSIVPQLFHTDMQTIEKLCSLLPKTVFYYLLQNDYLKHILQSNANSASNEAFIKRFFGWFDALKTVKYLNSSNLKQSTFNNANALLQKLGHEKEYCLMELLKKYRKMEKDLI